MENNLCVLLEKYSFAGKKRQTVTTLKPRTSLCPSLIVCYFLQGKHCDQFEGKAVK